MCGLVVLLRKDGYVTADDVAMVEGMLDRQAHRGPDGSGLWFDEHVVMGHNRLEIMDHGPAGHQPMASADGTVRAVYNGEIYNHRELRRELELEGYRFRSQTDTEVLVHGYQAWGKDRLIERLHGMFTFAIYDQAQPNLVVGRDRLGVKTLYLKETASHIFIASEVRTLRTAQSQSRRFGLADFLLWGSVVDPSTTLCDVSTMPCYGKGQGLLNTLRSTAPRHSIRGCLHYTIEQHRQGIVPQCVLQSGGLDSSALVALSKLPGVTVSCPPTYQEPVMVGHPHRWQGDDTTLREHADAFFAAMDQPSIDGFNVYLACRWAKELGYKVVWSGLGADELMGGYHHLRWAPDWRLGRATWLGYRRLRQLFSVNEAQRLLDEVLVNDQAYISSTCRRAWTFWEFDHYLKDQLLRDADTFSMAHGLELRVPYLDDRLVSHVLPLHDRGKSLLREAVKDVLPAAVLSRKKQGFTLPFDRWLMRDAGYWEDRALDNTPLVKKEVRNVWTRFRQRRLHWSRAWATVVAAQWRRWT